MKVFSDIDFFLYEKTQLVEKMMQVWIDEGINSNEIITWKKIDTELFFFGLFELASIYSI
jgi:hypothetical protein